MEENKNCSEYVIEHTAKIAKIEQTQEHLDAKIDEMKADIKQLIKIVQNRNESGAGIEKRLENVENFIKTFKNVCIKILLSTAGFIAVFAFTWVITHAR